MLTLVFYFRGTLPGTKSFIPLDIKCLDISHRWAAVGSALNKSNMLLSLRDVSFWKLRRSDSKAARKYFGS